MLVQCILQHHSNIKDGKVTQMQRRRCRNGGSHGLSTFGIVPINNDYSKIL